MLYTAMGTAAWLVWKRGGFAIQRRPLKWFLGQLALNALWTPIFFGAAWFGLAALEILVLWVDILFTIRAFLPVSRTAGLLLVPYLLWVSFASALNISLWWLNRA